MDYNSMNEKITVAITDDHSLMRQSISKFLTDMGFDVLIEAANADNLLQQLQQSDILPQGVSAWL